MGQASCRALSGFCLSRLTLDAGPRPGKSLRDSGAGLIGE